MCAITQSGLTISILFFSSISAAVTGPASFFVRLRFAVVLPFITKAIFFRLRSISITSSSTPSIALYSCLTPFIETSVIAEPTIDESIIRLKALPRVCPNPLSSGSRVTRVLFSEVFSIFTILGFNKLLKLVTLVPLYYFE